MTTCLHIFRMFFYVLLLMFSIVLLALTAYQIHFTETLPNGISFYIPIVVELLVTSCLGLIVSSLVLFAFCCEWRWCVYGLEFAFLAIIWIMNIVGAVILTRGWPNVNITWCTGVLGVCRTIDAIVSYAWINLIFTSWIFILAFFCSVGMGDPAFDVPAWKKVERVRYSTDRGAPETVERVGGVGAAVGAAGTTGTASTQPPQTVTMPVASTSAA